MAIADTLKVCQALHKTAHSFVASSMGYFIFFIFYIFYVNQSIEDLIYFTIHTSLLLNPGQGCYEKWIVFQSSLHMERA